MSTTAFKAQEREKDQFDLHSLLELIAEASSCKRYLEVGFINEETLVHRATTHRIVVEPKQLHFGANSSMEQVEVHESESDHFFFYNNRKYDLIAVRGDNYAQGIADVLNALNSLSQTGFVILHQLLEGDCWKILFDIWKQHPEIGYFTINNNVGLCVLWKNDPSTIFEPAWKQEVQNLDNRVVETAGNTFFHPIDDNKELVLEKIVQLLEQQNSIAGDQEVFVSSAKEFDQLLSDPASPDAIWLQEEDQFSPIDTSRFHSNFHPDVFRKTICAATGGNVLTPQKKIYLLRDALVSPYIPGNGKWPYRWHIQNRQGRFIEDVIQRRDINAPRTYTYSNPKRLEGLHLYLGWFAPYFGHFFTEMLFQLQAARALGNRDFKVLFNVRSGVADNWLQSTGPFKEFIVASFEYFGISLDKIVFIEQDVQVETLVAPTPVNVYQRGCRDEVFSVVKDVRQAVYGDTEDTPKRIYLSRKKINGRRLINGHQIEKLFEARGFTVLYPETLSLKKQLAIAANAEIIAGEEGSAFSAGLFANKPTIIELESGRFHPNLAKLSYMNAKDYVHIVPCSDLRYVPPSRNQSLIYGHPWVVDNTLASLFGVPPLGESFCGPQEVASLLEQGVFASLTGNVGGAIQSLLKILETFPTHFQVEWIEYFLTNLRETNISEPDEATYVRLTSQMLKALRQNQ